MMRILWVCLLTTGCLLAPSQAVGADEIGLSPDGVHWGSDLGGPLFDPDLQWVPGDTQIVRFHVRNQASSEADLHIAVRGRRGGADLSRALSFAARADGGPWVELARHGTGVALETTAFAVGRSMRVELRATFARSATNPTQRESMATRFEVTLTDVRAHRSARARQNVGVLAAAGSDASLWMLWVGAVVTGGGMALIAGSRQREEVADD